MKFLIIDTALPPDPNSDPQKIIEMLSETKELFSDWVKLGKIESWYHFSDRVGGIGILNAESLEELYELILSHPSGEITHTKVYPLINPIIGLEKHIEKKKRQHNLIKLE